MAQGLLKGGEALLHAFPVFQIGVLVAHELLQTGRQLSGVP